MRKLIFVLVLGFMLGKVVAQPSISKAYQETFAFEVKTIDEFFERFNDESTTLIKDYIKKNYPGKTFTRGELIKTLFNYTNPAWTPEIADAFVKHVVDSTQFLLFYDDEWFAKCICSVTYKGKPEKVTIIMQPYQDYTGAAKWTIRSASAPFLKLPQRRDPKKFLNPISHATDFMGLKKAMDDKMNITSYLYEDFKEDRLAYFVSELMNGNIVFLQTDRIVYHMLQINGWALTVEQYRRPGKNNGWLISSVSKLNKEQKENYKKKILYIDKEE